MFSGLRATRASDHLDLVRGLAAIAVLLYHVRYRFFLDFADLPERTLLATVWYAMTAFGHDAVIVFFVVSGLLVGSSAVRDCRSGRWSWGDYLTARFVRLYVVLVPGLLLTLFWDRLGLALFGGSDIYTGAPQWYQHDYFDVAGRSGFDTLAANAVFLQGIYASTFGSNDALWSLSYEFWYYMAFPLVALAFRGGNGVRRVMYAVGAVALLYWLGRNMALYFLIWLLGTVVGSLPPLRSLSRRPRRWGAVAAGVFGFWLLGSHTGLVRTAAGNSLWLLDSITGVIFAAWLYTFLHDRREGSSTLYGNVARRVANVSYTLYVVHLPLLVLLRAWLAPAAPWTPSVASLLAAFTIAAGAFAYAVIVAGVTEAHTATVRRAVTSYRQRLTLRLKPGDYAETPPAHSAP